jgi:hypothetical protein
MAMKTIMNYLEGLSKKEKIVQKAVKIIGKGETWTYPVNLDKGVDYSLKIKGCKNIDINCALTNGNGATPLWEAKGSRLNFSFVPEKTGTYGLTMSRDTAVNAENPEKVEVTLGMEYMPMRYIDGMFR